LPDKIVAQADSVQYDNNLMGVNVQTLTPAIRERAGIPSKVKGVIIAEIDPESPSNGILKPNDIICEVNRNRINDVDSYSKIVSKLQQKSRILLLIYRGGSHLYVIIE